MTDDGWYRSGDLGALDEDGYLSYLGRWKDMLKIGGENVAALEIESHIILVLFSQVVGIEDERYDEVAAVFIEAVPGANVSSQDIIDYCKVKYQFWSKICRLCDRMADVSYKIQVQINQI